MPNPEFRSRWRRWAARTLGGSEEQIEAATQAAMEAITANSSQDQAVQAARSAWGSHTRTAGSSTAVSAGEPSNRGGQIPAQAPRDVVVPAPIAPPVPPGRFRGRVAGFQQRFEVSDRRNILVWDFRVEQIAPSVGQTPVVAVEMRGYAFEGSIANGDEVEIVGQPIDQKVLHISAAYNLSSNALVRVSSAPSGNFRRAVGIIIKLGLVLLFAFLLFNPRLWLPLLGR